MILAPFGTESEDQERIIKAAGRPRLQSRPIDGLSASIFLYEFLHINRPARKRMNHHETASSRHDVKLDPMEIACLIGIRIRCR
jgi:hypothetical protein